MTIIAYAANSLFALLGARSKPIKRWLSVRPLNGYLGDQDLGDRRESRACERSPRNGAWVVADGNAVRAAQLCGIKVPINL